MLTNVLYIIFLPRIILVHKSKKKVGDMIEKEVFYV